MKKIIFGSILLFALLLIGAAGTAQAEVNVNINIGTPSELVMISSGFYYVPGASFDVFFYNGFWWSRRDGYWYRASQHNGPWGHLKNSYVPGPLFNMRKDYRKVYKKSIPFGQWEKQYGKKSGGQSGNQPGKNKGGGKKH